MIDKIDDPWLVDYQAARHGSVGTADAGRGGTVADGCTPTYFMGNC
jgi:hypothetical protein